MIGSFLSNTNGNIGKVVGLLPTNEVVMQYHSNSTSLSDPKLLLPIKITGDILMSNGWFFRTGYWTKKGPVRLSWKEDGTLIVGYFQFPCAVEFVHTLQNILRILGLEDIVL